MIVNMIRVILFPEDNTRSYTCSIYTEGVNIRILMITLKNPMLYSSFLQLNMQEVNSFLPETLVKGFLIFSHWLYISTFPVGYNTLKPESLPVLQILMLAFIVQIECRNNGKKDNFCRQPGTMIIV